MDIVRGTIIGGDAIQVELVQPSGNRLGNAQFFDNWQSALDWAKRTVAAMRSEHAIIADRIGYNQPWMLQDNFGKLKAFID